MVYRFDSDHPGELLRSYYEKAAALVNLGIYDIVPMGSSWKDVCDYYENTQQKARSGESTKKLVGAVTAEVFRQKIVQVLKDYPEYVISENNVYVEGCHLEFDFLILQRGAEKLMGLPVYRNEDAVAVLECKANGLYTLYKQGADFSDFIFFAASFILPGVGRAKQRDSHRLYDNERKPSEYGSGFLRLYRKHPSVPARYFWSIWVRSGGLCGLFLRSLSLHLQKAGSLHVR